MRHRTPNWVTIDAEHFLKDLLSTVDAEERDFLIRAHAATLSRIEDDNGRIYGRAALVVTPTGYRLEVLRGLRNGRRMPFAFRSLASSQDVTITLQERAPNQMYLQMCLRSGQLNKQHQFKPRELVLKT